MGFVDIVNACTGHNSLSVSSQRVCCRDRLEALNTAIGARSGAQPNRRLVVDVLGNDKLLGQGHVSVKGQNWA
jgi:hypothetical protein